MQYDYMYEWDPGKNEKNLKKHGVGFEFACCVWDDPYVCHLRSAYTSEERWLYVGKTPWCYLTVCVTFRKDSIRIISARRSSKREIDEYENNKRRRI